MNTAQRTTAAPYQGFLLDTNIISALAPGLDTHLPAGLAEWLHANDAALYIPCIAVAELAQGICKLHRVGGVPRAALLAEWLDQLIARFGDRVLALDATAAKLAGRRTGEPAQPMPWRQGETRQPA